MWSTGALGLQNPRSLLHLIWWNNVTHLGMRAFKEQYYCLIEDFAVTNQYVEYKERQTKNRQGDDGRSRKSARKYNKKIWKTDGGERDPYQAFIEYVAHRPKGENVPGIFFITPLNKPTSNIWYKAVPVGRNTLSKMMQKIASIASLDGKFTNSSGRKTVIQSLRKEFNPLEISELTGHADPNSMSSYSHNPAEKQRRMFNKLAGFTPSATTTTNDAGNTSSTSPQLWTEVVGDSSASALPPSVQKRVHDKGSYSEYPMKALSGLFTGVAFNNSPVNISINFQSNVNPDGGKSSSLH